MKLHGEKEAILTVVKAAERFGYGNLMAHLARVWAKKLVKSGLDKKTAVKATEGRHGYPLDFDYLEIDKELKDEYGI